MSLVADVFIIQCLTDSGSLIASTTLSSADVKISVDEKQITGGQGDALIAILHSARKVEVSVSEMTFKWDWIANQLGQTATTAAVDAWALPKFYTAATTTGVTITLSPLPLASSSGIEIYTSAGVLVPAANYSVVADTGVTTFTSGVTAGDILEVRGYKYTTAATASTINIDNTSFADGLVCVLTTIEIDTDETPLNHIQIILDECLPSGNFDISTKSARDASVSNFTFKAIKPATSTSLGRIIKKPIV
jgi:hypothetical protein